MNLRTRKILLTCIIALGGLFFFYRLADTFSPGSYGDAEFYELEYPEEKVIKALHRLKATNVDFRVPEVTIPNGGQSNLNDGRKDSADHWYKVYFYYKEEDRILFTWTRPNGRAKTTFAFVAVNDGLTLGHWKDVNGDFGLLERREIKNTFEERILSKLKRSLTVGD